MKRMNTAFFILFLLAVAVPLAARSEGRFERFDFKMKGEVTDVITEDLDQDGLMEAIVIYRDTSKDPPGRYMTIFPQGPNGFDQSRRIDWTFPSHVAAIDVGDVAAEAGKELVFITADGVSYATVHGGKVSALKDLIPAQSVVAMPYERGVPYYNFVWDYTGDGKDDILVVGFNKSLFAKQVNNYEYVTQLIEVQPHMNVQAWDVGKLLGDSEHPNFHVSYDVPEIYSEDTDADGLPDLVVGDNGRISVFRQNAEGFSQKPSQKYRIKLFEEEGGRGMRHPVQVAYKDLDGDKKMDLVAVQRKGSFGDISSKTALYWGKTGNMTRNKPDMVFDLKDSVMVVFVDDVNKDGLPDLLMPTMDLSAWGAGKVLFTGGLNVKWNYFLQKPDRTFNTTPDWITDTTLKFSIGKFRLEAGIPNVFGDFNGDGIPDEALGTDKDELTIFLKNANGGRTGVEEKLLIPVSMFNRTVDMNGDGKSDIIIHYEDISDYSDEVHIFINRGPWTAVD